MIYRGACHCGAVSAVYETQAPARLRHDGCSFCASRGVKSASDAHGKLAIVSTRQLTRYRFGHKSADFLICSRCGTYVAAAMPGAAGLVGVINVVGLQIPELKDEAAPLARLDDESPQQRIARRLTRWTPMTIQEGAGP